MPGKFVVYLALAGMIGGAIACSTASSGTGEYANDDDSIGVDDTPPEQASDSEHDAGDGG